MNNAQRGKNPRGAKVLCLGKFILGRIFYLEQAKQVFVTDAADRHEVIVQKKIGCQGRV